MKHRFIALLLAVLLLTALAACGGTAADPTATPAPATEAPEATAAPETGAPQETEDPQALVLPITEELTELTYWMVYSPTLSALAENPNELIYFQELENRTNIHLEFTLAQPQDTTQFSIMVAGGEYPDLTETTGMSFSSLSEAVEQEYALPLNDYVDLMPNYMALVESDDDLRKAAYLEDGTLAVFKGYNADGYPCNYGLVLRQDWLDAVGMDTPITYDDYYEVFKAWQTELGVEAPLWMNYSGVYQMSYFAAGYDVMPFTELAPYPPFYQVDGTVKFGPAEEGFRSYLEMMNQWYAEGLVYRDFVSTTSTFFPDFSLADTVGVYAVPIGLMAQMGSYSSSEDFHLVGAYDPVQKEGDQNHIRSYSEQVASEGVIISILCAEPEVAVRYLDYWYSEEGGLLLNYGVEGESYTLDDDGNPVFLDSIFSEDLSVEQSIMLVSKQSGSFVVDWTKSLFTYTDDQLEAMDIWMTADDTYLIPSAVAMNTEESEAYSACYAEILTYVQENIPKFIIGERSLDEFDAYVEELMQLGLQTCLDAKQSAYDRYMAR